MLGSYFQASAKDNPNISLSPREVTAMIRSDIRKVVALGLCAVLGLFFATVAQGQESKKDKVKLTGAELQQRASKYFVIAGYNQQNRCSWMIVNYGDGTTRKQYWECGPNLGSGISKGTFRVVEDKECSIWEEISFGHERCYEHYEIGENKYEVWIEALGLGNYFTREGVYYQLR
jgi:hypothetical protein